MHLKVKYDEASTPRHSDVATCTTWNSLDEVFSCGDDHKLFLWNVTKGEFKKVLDLPEDLFPTFISWPPKGSPIVIGPNKKNYEILLITATDGRMYLMGRGGRMEKIIQAHTGAILSASWSPDGSEILTSGEDGSVRIWSRTGSLRIELIQHTAPVYSSAWSPDCKHVVYSKGNNLVIKITTATTTAAAAAKKFLEWEAHSGVILCLAWSLNMNCILSGSEDCKYKVWTPDGQIIFTSVPFDYPITALSWAPNGNLFTVGSYKMLKLCSRFGWAHCQADDFDVGSVYNIQWSPDGSQFSCACANGQVILASFINDTIVWRNFEANLENANNVTIMHYNKNVRDRLEFRERVIKIELNYGYLLVVTLSQIYIYQVEQIATPNVCDIQEHGLGGVNFIIQTPRSFLVAGGPLATVWSYNGSKTATIKYPALRTNYLNPNLITLTSDLVGIIDQADTKQVLLFDPDGGANSGKGLGHIELPSKGTKNATTVVQISFSQHDYLKYSERILAIIDSNEDLYVAFIRRSTSVHVDGPMKLDSAAKAVIWHNEACILVAARDPKLRVYYLPQVLYMDMAVLDDIWEDKDAGDLGRIPQLLSYDVNRIELCKPDGTLFSVMGNPFIGHIQLNGLNGQIDKAHRIARYVNNKTAWGVFAALALWKGELDFAEIAFAEIGHNDKVLFIQAVKEVPDATSKKSQIQLLRGRPAEAESILLTAGRIGEAINVHIQTHNWERALELSLKAKENLPPLFEARAEYLKNLDLKAEYLPNYIETGKQLKQLMGNSSAGQKRKKNSGERAKAAKTVAPTTKQQQLDSIMRSRNTSNNNPSNNDKMEIDTEPPSADNVNDNDKGPNNSQQANEDLDLELDMDI